MSYPRQRRQRFDVYVDGVKLDRQCLAYDRGYVRVHYSEVYPGRQVEAFPAARQRRQTSREAAAMNGQTTPPWTFDDRAIRQACVRLGVSWPVRLRLFGNAVSQRGKHRLISGRHHITIDKWLDPETATRTLWHELTHAAQAERAGSAAEWSRSLKSSGYVSGGRNYKSHPFEVEADRNGVELSHIPLVRKN